MLLGLSRVGTATTLPPRRARGCGRPRGNQSHRSRHNFTRSATCGHATLRLMAPTFRKPVLSSPAAETPERLFDDLPRTRSGGPAQLWSHQADILRDYLRVQDKPDIALELPTGAGKTLPGLLIAECRRRAKGQRALFAAPRVQLARQTAAAAARIGVDVVTLTQQRRSTSTAVATRSSAEARSQQPRLLRSARSSQPPRSSTGAATGTTPQSTRCTSRSDPAPQHSRSQTRPAQSTRRTT